MTQIGLFCATGLSSALLVKALKEQLADDQNYQVNSAPFSEIFMVGNDYDFLILAPQTRFNQAKVAAAFPDKKIVLLTDEEFLSKNVTRIVEEIKI